MTRQEVIEQAAKNYAVSNDNAPDLTWARECAFMRGAEWADEHPKQITLSAADRGIIDEIIFALNSLGDEKMISYHKEIEFLNKIRKL